MIGATNRPDLLDNALLRPGRFDIHIYCPLPDEKTRFEIFKVHTRNLPLSEDVDLEKMAEITEGYSGMLLSLKWGMNRLISRCWNCCFVSWSCHLLSLWEHSEHDYWPIPFWRGVVEHYSKNITWFVASLPEIHWKIVLLCSVHCFYIINIVCSESIRKERVIENNVDLESADPVKRSGSLMIALSHAHPEEIREIECERRNDLKYWQRTSSCLLCMPECARSNPCPPCTARLGVSHASASKISQKMINRSCFSPKKKIEITTVFR